MITEITIGNMRQAPIGKPLPAGWVYVGRPTDLGNPFYLRTPASTEKRAEVISNYERWLDGMLAQPGSDQARMMDSIEQLAIEGEGVMTLVCFCSPLACHADIIAARLRVRLGLPEPGQEGGQQGEPDSGPGGSGEAQG